MILRHKPNSRRQCKVKARSRHPGKRLNRELREQASGERTVSPLMEFDASRVAIIEPSRVIEPIDIAEHCVLCFFQEVIAELVHEGARARHLHSGQSEVGGIWFCSCGSFAAHGIKMPDEMRVAMPSFGRGDVLDAVVVPKAARIAESGEAAFGADACAG